MKRPGVAGIFSGLALIFGGIFVFLTPPFQSPDEPNHFLRAFQVSEGAFFPEKQKQRLGGQLPASLVQVCDSFYYLKMNYIARLNPGLVEQSLGIPLNAERRVFADFPNTAIYNPAAYLPQAAGISLLRISGSTPLRMLYAARLSNLLVWILLVAAAIRLAPYLQHLFAVLALLPASLVIAASANADVITNGLCWCLIASFLRFAGKKSPPPSALPLLFKQSLAFAITCASKLIVFPLAGLYLLQRRDKIRYGFIVLAASGLAAALVWGSFAGNWFIPYDAYDPAVRDAQTLNEGVNPSGQLAHVVQHPLLFIRTAIISAVEAVPSALAHFAGKFGWEKNYLHPAWLALLWLTVAATIASAGKALSLQQRSLAAMVTALYIGMFILTMYMLWCPVGATEVSNFQGRYFVPVAPAAALIFASGDLYHFRKNIRRVAFFILAAGNVAMIFAMLGRYYG
ncbi:MAG: DUF2142 domain-containing protein [Lewinellaceae bacterium]|nr:DUF2142 domain-containing protein [Lewinellaceae bacterium]